MSIDRWTDSFIIGVGLFTTAGCHTTGSASADRNIDDVFVNVANIRHDAKSNGDTWDYIWADDDNLYSFGCDGKGYGATHAMNLNFNCLKGSAWNALTGQLVNPMNEYGLNGAYPADNSTDLVRPPDQCGDQRRLLSRGRFQSIWQTMTIRFDL